MNDGTTNAPLRVFTEGTAGPYIMVPVARLDEVRAILDKRGVRYCIEEEVISLDGGPEIAVVDLGRGGDAPAVQAMLDSVH